MFKDCIEGYWVYVNFNHKFFVRAVFKRKFVWKFWKKVIEHEVVSFPDFLNNGTLLTNKQIMEILNPESDSMRKIKNFIKQSKAWINTFLPHTINWYHTDGKKQILTNKEIRYISWKRDWYVKRNFK